MTAIPVYTLHCDGYGCRMSYSNERMRAVTAREARDDAVRAGWTRARRHNRLADLCPNCTRTSA